MRRLTILLLVVASVPWASAAQVGPAVYESYVVPTRHGKVFLRVIRPATGRQPVVLTYSPYNIHATDPLEERGLIGGAGAWLDAGITRAYADVVGTGNSGGCYDYGGRREKESGYDVVEWLARRSWSTGRIGMEGGSYDGTTAIATAVMRPPHLRTIVPIAAIARWYDYAYSGGWRYSDNGEIPGNEGPGAASDEGADTPAGFDFGLAVPPPMDGTGADFAGRFTDNVTPCDEVAHTTHGYSETPDYDAFWLERDYLKDAGRITIPVLVAANWGDWNVKQEESFLFYSALKNAKVRRLYMGSRWEGHGTPLGLPDIAWMQRWLLDKGTTGSLPAVTSVQSDSAGDVRTYAGAWPATSDLKLAPSATALSTSIPAASSISLNDAARTEWSSLANPTARAGWLWVQTAPLTRDVRVFGRPSVNLSITTDRPWLTAAVSVADVDPGRYMNGVATSGSQIVAVTRGWLDSRYRSSLSRRAPASPKFSMTVIAKPVDYLFRRGHSIGLLVQTQTAEWTLSKSQPACACATISVSLGKGSTLLRLPVAGAGRTSTLFR